MASKTKHCPFKHPISRGAQVDQINHHYRVLCEDCGATGPERESYAEAQEAWNARRIGNGKAEKH